MSRRQSAAPTVVTLSSDLTASPDRVWQWMTSFSGILREMAPLMRMTVPRSVAHLTTTDVQPGQRLFRSWVLLFGVLPIDRSDLTLVSLDPGKGFVEESPMLTMKLWRHQRSIQVVGGYTRLTDEVTFEPRFAAPLVTWFVRKTFAHRHAVLRAQLGDASTPGTR
jgi:ligand-binding SRPBCC domain-containing protein